MAELSYRQAHELCTKSKLPASDYVINPYVGCTHRCMYCYAKFMGRFTGHNEPWGTYLECKKYDTMRLPKQLEGKTILIGSVTDAYNPAEAKFKSMRDILHTLSNCAAHVEILTKSALVTRDIDLISRIPDVSVGVSLSSLIDADNRVLEPGASSATERIATLKTLHEHGISTYLFIAPYLPGVTSIDDLLNAVKGSIDYACVENLNLRGASKHNVLSAMAELHPECFDLYKRVYLRGDTSYWHDVESELAQAEKKHGIRVISYLYHDKIKKK